MVMQGLNAAELSDLVSVLPEIVIVTDTSRRIRFINRVAEGFKHADIIGADCLNFVEPAYQERQAQLFQQVLVTGERASYEIPIVDADGDQEWYEGRLIPISHGSGVSAVVITTRNVTARHQAKEEARRLRGLLPVCSSCNEVRDDEGYWQEVGSYIEERSDSRVTHGMCPECEEKIADNEGGDVMTR